MRDRKLNRCVNWNYFNNGCYFITICTGNRMECFGKIIDQKMVLNSFGEIVNKQWNWLNKNFLNIKLDDYIIMPDHFHGIIKIYNISNVGTGLDLSLQKKKNNSLSEIIGAFKTTSSKLIHQNGKELFRWQRSFHDRIIRNEIELNKIRNYIRENPLKFTK